MNYLGRVEELQRSMTRDYMSVSPITNPFMRNKDGLSKEELQCFIAQYSFFPKSIVSFLTHAIYGLNYSEWLQVSNELATNISEELGVCEQGEPLTRSVKAAQYLTRPHYVVLRQGVSDGLGIDIKAFRASSPTNEFLDTMTQLMDADSPGQVAGSATAMESTAVPELCIVYHLVKRLFELSKKEPPTMVRRFFDCHIDDIEVGHAERLVSSCANYVTSERDICAFECGFRQVMSTMDKWWDGLYSEATKV